MKPPPPQAKKKEKARRAMAAFMVLAVACLISVSFDLWRGYIGFSHPRDFSSDHVVSRTYQPDEFWFLCGAQIVTAVVLALFGVHKYFRVRGGSA